MKTIFHKLFAPVKNLPAFIHLPIRGVLTGLMTPAIYSLRTGHFRSSLVNKPVDRKGNPLPWYSYSLIDFLYPKDFTERNILEFGAGQSTFWWAKRSKKVVSFEGDLGWYNKLKQCRPANVDLHLVSIASPQQCVEDILTIFEEKKYGAFDIVALDGLWRFELCRIAKDILTPDGIIIADNANGYGIYEAFKDERDFRRVDFWGNAPGVMLEHCSSVFFRSESFLFGCNHKLPYSIYGGMLCEE